ncbi:hypothetical protein Gohar_028231 [Gossypium harknessii]|uniref:Uncharacterized protein n=1 Tax=Gossypium harknessii TaxID=34285 RepID=A0A7J9I5Z1_9ROSI|nr:hypothetical protein [Gossypium harknessii]
MRWLEDNFEHIKASVSHIEKEQFTQGFILRLIRGPLISDKSHNLELDNLHKIDLRLRLKEDWETFHKKCIEIWKYKYDYLPTREPFLTLELVTCSDYMDWFRHHGRLYL